MTGPVKVRPNEIAHCTLKLVNTGTVDWPKQTKLFQVGYSGYSAFPATQLKPYFKVGVCEPDKLKVLTLPILALKGHIGIFTFYFRLGTSPDTLFGDTFQTAIVVEGSL